MNAALRNQVLSLVRLAMRLTIGLLSRSVPQRHSVVVSAFPESEGNALEAARALLDRYDGEVVWLSEADRPRAEVAELVERGMVLVPKASIRGLWHYLRAEAVFFTHGLYGSPRPAGRKPIVNLWHGDGPKATRPGNGAGSLIPSTYMVAGTELFGRYKADAFEVPHDRLLVTGNPRTDQLWRPVSDAALADLGIVGDFVLCMPTFRRTRGVNGVPVWSEVADAAADRAPELLAPLLEMLDARGVQLVVKPHPMDADLRRWDGVVTVTDEELGRVGVGLYGLLGRSCGLVTDYSSVWVDYLLLDRPLAFLVADRDSYTRALVPADVLDWLPGELVGDDEPFGQFVADLDSSGALGAVLRKEVAGRIGLNPTRSSAADLVTALAERGALRTRAVAPNLGPAASAHRCGP